MSLRASAGPELLSVLPSAEDVLAGVRIVSVPMAVRFRGVMHREAALIEGPHGWGEFSPFLEYGSEEASRWLAAGLESAYLPPVPALRSRVPVNATVPAVAPEEVERVLARFLGVGGSDGQGLSIKVKVAERGQGPEEDVARLAQVRALAPRAHIRVDANMGYGTPAMLATDGAPGMEQQDYEPIEKAVRALTLLAEFGLQYAEQPVATVAGLRRVREELARREVPVRIAADESIRRAGDPLLVAQQDAADLIVVKNAPLGGTRSALAVIEACGLPAVVSSALDTSVGIAAGVHLAAALPQLDYACGLGTLALAADDVAAAPMKPFAGEEGGLWLEDRSGVGLADPAKLDGLAAPEERVQWWHKRIRAAWQHLG